MEYFAAVGRDRIAAEIQARIDAYYNWILVTNRLSRWRTAYNTYYGQRGTHAAHYVQAGGDKGELAFLMSNEYRNLVQHLLVLVMQSKTSLETVAVNTDAKSKAQSYVAKGLLEYFRRDGGMDQAAFEAAEISLIMDSGWVFNEWDPTLGTDFAVDPDTGVMLPSGDIRTRARTPLDVVIDYTKMRGTDRDWVIVRDAVNKYDLAAQYPEQADDIVSIERDLTKDVLYRFGDIVNYPTALNSPDIDRWTLFHRKSLSMMSGRVVQMVGNIVLLDDDTPYRKLPGNRICPSEQILSPFGYSSMNDLLGLQDVLDSLISYGTTAMNTSSGNLIWTKPGGNFDFEQLADGQKLIESDEKPEVLLMNRLSPEWMAMTRFIIERMEAISGINAVARGNTEGKDFSGAAMALLESVAIRFNSGFTRATNRLIEENGNDIIQLTQDFVAEPKMGIIIGENNRYMLRSYSGEDLNTIQRVYCRQSNPMKDTTSGRLTIIQEAAKTEGGLTKAQFAEILDTGNTDCLLEQDRNSKLAIDMENEALVRGEVPPVVFTENPIEHIKGHSRLVHSPDDKKDPALVMRVRQHIQEHLTVWQQTDPNVLAALGIPPFQMIPIMPGQMPPGLPDQGITQPPMPPMPGMGGPPMPGAPGAPTGAPMPPQGDAPPPPPQAAAAQMAPTDAPPNVRMPGMPKNPLSGEEYDSETGGLPQAI